MYWSGIGAVFLRSGGLLCHRFCGGCGCHRYWGCCNSASSLFAAGWMSCGRKSTVCRPSRVWPSWIIRNGLSPDRASVSSWIRWTRPSGTTLGPCRCRQRQGPRGRSLTCPCGVGGWPGGAVGGPSAHRASPHGPASAPSKATDLPGAGRLVRPGRRAVQNGGVAVEDEAPGGSWPARRAAAEPVYARRRPRGAPRRRLTSKIIIDHHWWCGEVPCMARHLMPLATRWRTASSIVRWQAKGWLPVSTRAPSCRPPGVPRHILSRRRPGTRHRQPGRL